MAHEDLTREDDIEGSSDRAFGVVFAVFLLLVAAWPLLHAAAPRWWAGGLALLFGLAAALRPALLARLNRVWIRFGILLGRIIAPIALGLLFFGVLTPMSAIMRIAGKRPLRLAFESAEPTYWITRRPPGPAPESMTNQF